ncbi:DUF932 domain-containing protein [Xenophilus sp. Marseille-Q4582]|uniref:DUF932 domain-containing protein n=1 Tax=Xenophilus sp. Marseille-Q4582 TaxID=2866600 RepID=UPI001CE49139|nr:DUF932 domain-containing protein [Xenophilus sp. Marseille-Q4582]
MAHQIENMAYVGATPWHGLGKQLPAKQSIDVWAREAGMDWSIEQTPVCFQAGTESTPDIRGFDEHKVLFRSDTKAPLSVVGGRYQVVQPREVLEFYRDLTEISGFELETAGVLKAGRKFWALARTGQSTALGGKDVVNGYLLLATSCDGTLATTCTPTTVRVVCNNTLTVALDKVGSQGIRVPHSTRFDAQAVKKQLGIAVARWDDFMYRMNQLSARKVRKTQVERFIRQVLTPVDLGAVPAGSPLPTNERAMKKVQALFDGQGRGAELSAAKGTAWGLLCAVTEFVDHERRARSQEYRLDSAWFGQGAGLKQRALDAALELIA